MSLPPLVSIIIPVFDDESTIEASLRSAIGQTLDQVEILVVDDGSTDNTTAIVDQVRTTDDRIRLLKQPQNMSAFQARLRGIQEATSPYVMFLDGDDELERNAAATAANLAESTQADIVHFGVSLLWANSIVRPNSAFEKRLQPIHRSLEFDDIVLKLFPAGQPAGGQLWKYLFRTEILKEAYTMLPPGLKLYRANDLPISYLASAVAKKYVSTPEKLYRYHFQRGGSGNRVSTIDQVEFQMLALESFQVISDAVNELTYRRADPQALLDSYSSARFSIIGTVLRYLARIEDEGLKREAISRLEVRTSRVDVVRAAALFQPQFLDVLPHYCAPVPLGERGANSVLLTTSQLTTGGVSGVLLAQAKLLLLAGCKVTIAAQRSGSDQTLVPDGARFYDVSGEGISARLECWAEICENENIDVVIEHRVLYSRQWNAFALMARACGASTIGWIHNFAGRPIYDLNNLHSFMRFNVPILSRLIVLSPLDVAFWKLRGVEHTSYLPNPPSPLLLENGVVDRPRRLATGKVRLVWVGRLDQHTKQVLSLLDVATHLKKLDFEFTLTVVGPEWHGMTVDKFNAEASKRGLEGLVTAVGPLVGDALMETLDSSHAFVGTSVIEGYQLTLVEAQSRGLPVFMYEMPWLVPVQDNRGIVASPQGNAAALARSVVEVFSNADEYEELSENSLIAAQKAFSYDFAALYEQLIHNELPEEFSPSLDVGEASKVLDWTVFFAERNAGIRKRLEDSTKASNSLRRQLKSSQSQVSTLEGRVRKVDNDGRPTGSHAPIEVARAAVSSAMPVPAAQQRPGASSTLRRSLGGLKRLVRRSLGPTPSSAPDPNAIVAIDRAELSGPELILQVRPDVRGLPSGIDAIREVDGVEERHPFEVSIAPDGFVKGTLDYSLLGHRRWIMRANFNTAESDFEVTLPFRVGATRRSEGPHRMRLFNGTTLQVVAK